MFLSLYCKWFYTVHRPSLCLVVSVYAWTYLVYDIVTGQFYQLNTLAYIEISIRDPVLLRVRVERS